MKTLPITINSFRGILLVVYCIELLCSIGLLVLCSWPFQTFVLLCVWCRLFNFRIFTQTVQTIKLQIMQNNPLSRNCLEMLLHLKKILNVQTKVVWEVESLYWRNCTFAVVPDLLNAWNLHSVSGSSVFTRVKIKQKYKPMLNALQTVVSSMNLVLLTSQQVMMSEKPFCSSWPCHHKSILCTLTTSCLPPLKNHNIQICRNISFSFYSRIKISTLYTEHTLAWKLN